MTKTIEIKTDCFPKLLESGFLPKPKGVGRAMKDLFFDRFGENATNLMITNTNPHSNVDHTLKHIPAERICIDFYKWDYQLDTYRNSDLMDKYMRLAWFKDMVGEINEALADEMNFRYSDKYDLFLRDVASKGIDKCVGMDFSLWWDQPGPTLINNLYLNMCRLRQAQDLGFKTIFNWNNAMPEFRCIYEDILPAHVPVVMADSNHELTQSQLAREIDALKMFTEITTVDAFIIQSSRMNIKYMEAFIIELDNIGIKHVLLPSQTALLGGVRNKQELMKDLEVDTCATL